MLSVCVCIPLVEHIEERVILTEVTGIVRRIEIPIRVNRDHNGDRGQQGKVKGGEEQVYQEQFVVSDADASINPWTVVVKPMDTSTTGVAVFRSRILDDLAGKAEYLPYQVPLLVRLIGTSLIQDGTEQYCI